MQTTVTTASGICHTVTATCRYHGEAGTGLSVLLRHPQHAQTGGGGGGDGSSGGGGGW